MLEDNRVVKKKIILYPHGGSENHGCEALVRVLVKQFDKNDVILYSSNKEQDEKYGISKICYIRKYENEIKRFSKEHIELMFRKYVKKDRLAYEIMPYYHMLKQIKKSDVAISFGGDNYCYDGMVYQLKIIDKELDKKKINRVLWGCSVESVNNIEKDLKGFQIISARESMSYEIIRKINSNVFLFPDPAFVLEMKQCKEICFENECGYVGINLSPMVIDNEKNNGIVLKNYLNLIKYILEKTDMKILLIPHVVWTQNNDMKSLQILKSYFNNERVILCQDHNCMEQKYIISKCRFMIAARTHASIAAYSTSVPTLVIGYSIKSKGIAKDLFGKWENYVKPVQSMKTENELVRSFQWLMKNESAIRKKYENFMPDYIEWCKEGLYKMAKMIKEL